jgi:hypothetical protein
MPETRHQGAGGLNEAAAQPARAEDLGGAGGSSGGGTSAGAGAGQPSGGTLDHAGGAAAGSPGDDAGEKALVAAGADSLASQTRDPMAAEAAALGAADGSLADAGRDARPALPGSGPVGGETLRTGSGRSEIGSGTPPDRGEAGGGGPIGQHGGTGPAGTSSPGGNRAG